ncbi:MAG TPA: ornithine aminomutase subunit alpha [Anaerovoracaceae bacterium]|nr:ornithine aminomutase subunit alpha [Anaerovoracaceae bacterium]
MKRQDDFEERRKHIANLSDEELYNKFWETTEEVVKPLLDLGYKNTTPSVERSVLLRMGVSSLDTQKIVENCMDRNLMRKGAGHCVYKLSKLRNISIREASIKLAEGDGWNEVAESFKEVK